MAIEGNHRPIPAKSGPSNRQRRNPAAAANPLPPAPVSSTPSSAARPAITQEHPGHETHMQKDQQQPRQPQHTQRHQQQRQQEHHFRHQQNRVGKRYRDKLTAGFESLQTTLGLDEEVGDEMDAADGAGRGGEGGGEGAQGDGPVTMGSTDGAARRRRRPLNKARIIDLTCERVRELVEEWEATRAEVEAMRRERALQGW